MLEMEEGRISFAEVLRPPVGYEVAFVVGTTYSLDLRALLGLCIPLGLGFEPEALESINAVSLFAALHKLRGKLVVYCDKGGIKADIPAGSRSLGLIALLEGMVHQVHVNTGRPGIPSSFHPKVWVVEYKAIDGDARKWRLLSMSRNLTFDKSWDVIVQLDGKPGNPNACSEHVSNFLEFLASGSRRIDTERDDTRKRGSHTSRVRRMARDVRNVEFLIDDKSFDSVDFLPLGPMWQGGSDLLLDAKEFEVFAQPLKNALVVSPFLGDSSEAPLVRMLKNRSGSAGRFVLLSREDSLNRMGDELRAGYECFCPVPALADVELEDADGTDAESYSNVHAKLYFVEDRFGRRALYIGSLNASYNGTVNNVESLVKLGVSKGYHTFSSMLKPLIECRGKEMAPFSPYVPMDEESAGEDDERAFDLAFRMGSKCFSLRHVAIQRVDDDSYALNASVSVSRANAKCTELSFSLRPLLSSHALSVEIGPRHVESLRFERLGPQQLSAMFVLEGKDKEGHSDSCVLICPRDRFDDSELSIEARSKLLLKEILSNQSGALTQYIAHAFELPEASYALAENESVSTTWTAASAHLVPSGFYERLLDMAANSPEVFERAAELMALLPKDVRTSEVDRLRRTIDVFEKAVR